MSKWHKPTEKEKLDETNENYGLPKKKGKHLNWWDKIKVAVYEHETTKDADEQKQLPQKEDEK
jgi:hypothetical protein